MQRITQFSLFQATWPMKYTDDTHRERYIDIIKHRKCYKIKQRQQSYLKMAMRRLSSRTLAMSR